MLDPTDTPTDDTQRPSVLAEVATAIFWCVLTALLAAMVAARVFPSWPW